MEKKYETEVVKGVEGNRGLNLAMGELKKNKRNKKISKICSIVVPILIAFIVFGTPILMHYSNRGKHIYWKNMIVKVSTDYTELEKTSSASIEELNKEKQAKFYWLDNMTRTESYILTYNEETVLIEEHYNYEGIECIIYIKHLNSKIQGIGANDNSFQHNYVLSNQCKVKYNIESLYCYGKFSKEYDYLFTISSTDTTVVESIFSNLTND